VSPLAQSIRFWLMRRPRPVKVRLHVGKDISEIETGAGVSWARVAETVDSMDATKLEALDEKGTLIRACKPDELAEPDDDDDGLHRQGVLQQQAAQLLPPSLHP